LGEETPAPKTLSESILEVVIILSEQWRVPPFETLKTDIDDFIMLLNYYMNLDKQNDEKPVKKSAGKEKRIKVNDRTATGGWF
jgi:hypothetical protein